LLGEVAGHRRDVDADFLEHFALHQPAHTATGVGVTFLLALPGQIVEAGVGSRLSLNRFELCADAVAQALEPLLRAGGIWLPFCHRGSLPKPPTYGKGGAWFLFRSPSSSVGKSSG